MNKTLEQVYDSCFHRNHHPKRIHFSLQYEKYQFLPFFRLALLFVKRTRTAETPEIRHVKGARFIMQMPFTGTRLIDVEELHLRFPKKCAACRRCRIVGSAALAILQERRERGLTTLFR